MKSPTQYERGMAEAYRLTMLARLKNERREAELAAAKAPREDRPVMATGL